MDRFPCMVRAGMLATPVALAGGIPATVDISGFTCTPAGVEIEPGQTLGIDA